MPLVGESTTLLLIPSLRGVQRGTPLVIVKIINCRSEPVSLKKADGPVTSKMRRGDNPPSAHTQFDSLQTNCVCVRQGGFRGTEPSINQINLSVGTRKRPNRQAEPVGFARRHSTLRPVIITTIYFHVILWTLQLIAAACEGYSPTSRVILIVYKYFKYLDYVLSV